MYTYNPVTKTEGDFFIVGRGATAIYLLLKSLKHETGRVIVPANICYAAVYPVIYAGYTPVFCDVDKQSGNITYNSLSDCCGGLDDIIAVIVPHMYGNPVRELLQIKEFCITRGILLIEDCASMMGGNADNYIPGTVGDYTIYSTGYSKTLDCGIGGILYSHNHSLSEIANLAKELPSYEQEFNNTWAIFSKIYRVLRNEGQFTELSQQIYKIMPDAVRNTFLFTVDNATSEDIYRRLDKLDAIIEQRRAALKTYQSELKNTNLSFYVFEQGAVPWRFNFFVEPAERNDFISYCLGNDVPVSDWYPRVTPMFGDDNIYESAEWHEERILNLPLMIEKDEILRICSLLINYLNKL